MHHAHRPEETDLPRAFDDGQRQRIGDPQHRDDDRKEQEPGEQNEHLIDLRFGVCDEFALVLDLHVGVVRGHTVDGGSSIHDGYPVGAVREDVVVGRVGEADGIGRLSDDEVSKVRRSDRACDLNWTAGILGIHDHDGIAH